VAVTCDELIQSLDTEGRAQLDQIARHTAVCETCHKLWRTHQRLTLSSRAPAEALEPSEALRRALQDHQDHPEPTPGSSPLRRLLTVLLPLLGCLALACLALARPDFSHVQTLPYWSGVLLLGSCLGFCLSVLVWRDSSGFGASPRLRWGAVAIALGIFALFASVDGLHGPEDVSHPLPQDCLLFGLAVAGAVSAAAFRAVRHSVLSAPSASGALAGCIGGIGGVLWLHFHCAAGAGLHLVIGHGLAFALAVLVSMLLGRRSVLPA
jgi:hypothetical protein